MVVKSVPRTSYSVYVKTAAQVDIDVTTKSQPHVCSVLLEAINYRQDRQDALHAFQVDIKTRKNNCNAKIVQLVIIVQVLVGRRCHLHLVSPALSVL
jgi:hypothetical protein